MSKKNQNYTNRKQNRFQPERMRGNVFVNNSGKQWLPGENGRAAKVERLLRGVKEKKKEIADNMAGYKDSGIEWIGAIPEGWDIIRIGYAFCLRSEKNYLPKDKVQLLSLYTGVGVFPTGSENTKASGNHAQTVIGYKIVHKNDIVVNIILAWMGAIGESNYDGVVSPAYDVYIPDLLKIVPHYAHYVFRTDGIAGECFKYGRGIMLMRWRTYSSEFKQIKIPFPPLPEQQRIADFLDTKCGILDRTIDAVSRQIEDLEKYKKALITKTVTKGICKKGEAKRKMKDSGVEWIGDVPEEWSVKRLKYVLASIRNGAPAAAVEYSSELPRYVRITDIDDNGRLKETGKQSLPEDIAKRYMLDKEAVLIASVGSLGKTMLFNPDTEKEKCAFAGYLIEAVTNPEAMNSKFLFYFIKSNAYMDWANRNFVQTTIQNLSAGRHKNLPVTVPPLAEQQQIADYLDEKCKNIDNRVQKRRQQLEWLKEYKKSLIFDYVTGKKRVEE